MADFSVDAYGAPLFFAWQLTNRCSARCLACCEESGPDKAWNDELGREAALDLTAAIISAEIPYVAFGGGEPLGVPHCWDIFERLSAAGIALKLETDGSRIDERGADRLAELGVDCIQISVDGATAPIHEAMRPGASFDAATGAIRRLHARGLAPEFVFVPSRLNRHEAVAALELAADLGCRSFVTGPMMRIGRAAANWQQLACAEADWAATVAALETRHRELGGEIRLSIYPWDILTEIERRLESPQAMLLTVPNGSVKLLNALPFAPANLARDSIETAWNAYRDAWKAPEVRAFAAACRDRPELLRFANETWSPDDARRRVDELLAG
jgi:MoaA/NifB/PqqE/SkfB family radical SAM enzyme